MLPLNRSVETAAGLKRFALSAASESHIPILSIATTVLWVGCAIVALLGFVLSYTHPQPAAKPLAPVQAQLLNVDLTQDLPRQQEPSHLPAALIAPPPLAPAPTPPQAPPLMSVAEPGASVAFALPIDGPAQIVEPARAAYVRPPQPGSATAAVQTLTYGRGEGKQPAPEYPSRAARDGQEGTVRVRFSVGENGKVLSADAFMPSPWPLLDEAAVKAVRERWRFGAGPSRRYEVAIRFELEK